MTCMTCYDSVVIPKRLGILESSPAPVNVYVYVRLRSQLPFTEPLGFGSARDSANSDSDTQSRTAGFAAALEEER